MSSKTKWDIINLSELRKGDEEWITLKCLNMLLHKGRENESLNEVGFIIRKEHTKRVINFRAISDRIACIRYKINSRQSIKICLYDKP